MGCFIRSCNSKEALFLLFVFFFLSFFLSITKCWSYPFGIINLRLLPQTRVMKEESSSESPWRKRDREVRMCHAVVHCTIVHSPLNTWLIVIYSTSMLCIDNRIWSKNNRLWPLWVTEFSACCSSIRFTNMLHVVWGGDFPLCIMRSAKNRFLHECWKCLHHILKTG